MLVDTHCHLGLLERAPEEVVAEARAEGVGHLVDVGIDLDSSRRAAANAARLEHVSATAGVHPHDAVAVDDRVLGELRALLADERVVAAGETGLDYYRDHSPRDVQRAAFAAHVRLARELDKALVVHCREAFGDVRAAARVVEAGWYVSFAGTVTFRNAPEQRAACAVVPLDQMVLETDSPFLSPHPYRGRPNHPGRVAVTAATVAAVHDLPVDQVAERTTRTATRAFRLPLAGLG